MKTSQMMKQNTPVQMPLKRKENVNDLIKVPKAEKEKKKNKHLGNQAGVHICSHHHHIQPSLEKCCKGLEAA
jgi:hypothetical protein